MGAGLSAALRGESGRLSDKIVHAICQIVNGLSGHAFGRQTTPQPRAPCTMYLADRREGPKTLWTLAGLQIMHFDR